MSIPFVLHTRSGSLHVFTVAQVQKLGQMKVQLRGVSLQWNSVGCQTSMAPAWYMSFPNWVMTCHCSFYAHNIRCSTRSSDVELFEPSSLQIPFPVLSWHRSMPSAWWPLRPEHPRSRSGLDNDWRSHWPKVKGSWLVALGTLYRAVPRWLLSGPMGRHGVPAVFLRPTGSEVPHVLVGLGTALQEIQLRSSCRLDGSVGHAVIKIMAKQITKPGVWVPEKTEIKLVLYNIVY